MSLVIAWCMSNLSFLLPILAAVAGLIGFRVSKSNARKDGKKEASLEIGKATAEAEVGALKKRNEVKNEIKDIDNPNRDATIARLRNKYRKTKRTD